MTIHSFLLCISLASSWIGPLAAQGVPATPIDGPIDTWVLHLDPKVAEDSAATYRSLLRQIRPQSKVLVAVDKALDFDLFKEQLALAKGGPIVTPLVAHAELSPWARDRYLIAHGTSLPRVLMPGVDTVDPTRRGDLAAGLRLAAAKSSMQVVESDLALEGGNVLIGEDIVLIGSDVIRENEGRFSNVAGLTKQLEALFGKRVLLVGTGLEGGPGEHLDMLVSLIGPRRVLVGSTALASSYFELREDLGLSATTPAHFGTADRKLQEQWSVAYDEIARQLEDEGLTVERVPALHTDSGAILTWTNVVLERAPDGRRVYLPQYGIPLLDRAAVRAWTRSGFLVRPVDCQRIIHHGGALRCLTQTIRIPITR